MTDHPTIEADEVSKIFGSGAAAGPALRGDDMPDRSGEVNAEGVLARSGKTPLLNVLGGLEDPDTGEVRVGGVSVGSMNDERRSQMRRTEVAFVFQAFGLLPMLTAAENIEVPMRLAGVASDARRERARELLDSVGLGDRALHRPADL